MRSYKIMTFLLAAVVCGFSGIVSAAAQSQAASGIDEGQTVEYIKQKFPSEYGAVKRDYEQYKSYYHAYEKDIEEYHAYIESLDSEEFQGQFLKYQEQFSDEQKQKAMEPYIQKGEEILSRAKDNYEKAKELIDRYNQQVEGLVNNKVKPSLGRQSFNAGGVFGMSFSAVFSMAEEVSANTKDPVVNAVNDDIVGSDEGDADYSQGYINEDQDEAGGDAGAVARINGAVQDIMNAPTAVQEEFVNIMNEQALLNKAEEKLGVDIPSSGAELGSSVLDKVGGDVGGKLGGPLGLDASSKGPYVKLDQMPTGSMTRYAKEYEFALSPGFSNLFSSSFFTISPSTFGAPTFLTSMLTGGGKGFLPMCDGPVAGRKGTGGAITRFSYDECIDRFVRLTPYGGSLKKFFNLASPVYSGGSASIFGSVLSGVLPGPASVLNGVQDQANALKDQATGVLDQVKEATSSVTGALNVVNGVATGADAPPLAQLVPITVEKADKASFGALMNAIKAETNKFLKDRKGQLVLRRSSAGLDAALGAVGNLTGSGFDLGSITGIPSLAAITGGQGTDALAVTKDGNEFANYNTRFSNDPKLAEKEVIEQGYCMMVADPKGKYTITENPNYVPTYDPYEDPSFNPRSEIRHKKYFMKTSAATAAAGALVSGDVSGAAGAVATSATDSVLDSTLGSVSGAVSGLTGGLVGGGKPKTYKASLVEIVDPEHPFSPRHKSEWKDFNGIFYGCGYSVGNAGSGAVGAASTIQDAMKVMETATTVMDTAEAISSGNYLGAISSTGGALSSASQINGLGTAGQTLQNLNSQVEGVKDSVQGKVDSIVAPIKQQGQDILDGVENSSAGQAVSGAANSVNQTGENISNGVSDSAPVKAFDAAGKEISYTVNAAGEKVDAAGNKIENSSLVQSGKQLADAATAQADKILGQIGLDFKSLKGVPASQISAFINSPNPQTLQNLVNKIPDGKLKQAALDKMKSIPGGAQSLGAAGTALAVLNNTITTVCGTDPKELLGGKKAWEAAKGGTFGKKKKKGRPGFKMKGGRAYPEWEKPLKMGGKILTTDDKWAKYVAIGSATYYACTIATWGMGGQKCCDIAEYLACQKSGVYDHVEPKNKLLLSYTAGYALGEGDTKLPHITTNKYDSYEYNGYKSNGLSWYSSEPIEKFGANGPWIKSLVTGDVGYGAIAKMDKKKYAQYMLTVVGVNPGYKPDESNPTSKQAYNMSCGTGGWEALKRYQMNCARVTGVNCICDYQKSFFKHTAWGYVLDRVSAYGRSIESTKRYVRKKVMVNGKEYWQAKEVTKYLNWPRKILMSRDGYPVNAQANYQVGGKKTNYPGKTTKGLSAAEVGSIIVMQKPSGGEVKNPDGAVGQFKRHWTAAFVESINPVSGCLTVSTKNNPSIFLDACGNSENIGQLSTYVICPSPNSSSLFKYPGGQLASCAENNEYYECYDPDWNSWDVFNPYYDKTGYSPRTGVAVNSNCSSFHKSINNLIEQMNRNGSKNDYRTQMILGLQERAKANGCPPDPKWGVTAGSYAAGFNQDSGIVMRRVPAKRTDKEAPLPIEANDLSKVKSGILNSLPIDIPDVPELLKRP